MTCVRTLCERSDVVALQETWLLREVYEMILGVEGGWTTVLFPSQLGIPLSNGMRVGCRVDGVRINNISYADDMVLLGPTARSFEEILKAASNNLKELPEVTLNGMNIKRVSFKYLGHYVTDDLKDNADIDRERRALAGAYGLTTPNGRWRPYVYTNYIFRMMLGLPSFCSASGMFAEYETDGFAAILRKKTASLMRRVWDSPNSILQTVAGRITSPTWQRFMRKGFEN
ncbi:uncharacterized protein LOC113228348 [Hyposmocoma kahamanoa]|uniref:uncharacterized protein LOC113228348 n=1 Tax=Hyposmocoma kahamanoa TaxID=1477025 RepID=UPI000E6D97BE|nr:uncharacterized protein LOC113228348 [Hyposmocoma kahamanoa]